MTFFEDLEKKINKAGQAVVDKASSIVDSSKLSYQVSSEEKALSELYRQLGFIYYTRREQLPDEQIDTLCDSIRQKVSVLRGPVLEPGLYIFSPESHAGAKDNKYCNQKQFPSHRHSLDLEGEVAKQRERHEHKEMSHLVGRQSQPQLRKLRHIVRPGEAQICHCCDVEAEDDRHDCFGDVCLTHT